MSVEGSVRAVAEAAKTASCVLCRATDDQRRAALRAMATGLRAGCEPILAANGEDMRRARETGMALGLLDRLLLNPERIESMAVSLEELAAAPDAIGELLELRTLDNGLLLKRVSVPLGVVAVVYEARPNVTADAAGICIRTGNAVVLRGGSSALESNLAIARILSEAVASSGLPAESVSIIDSADRAATDALMRMRGLVDVLIPRGGAGLIRRCVENSRIPVIETGVGNCHTYVHATADADMAAAIVLNAKTSRPGVCNACESLLVDRAVAQGFLPRMARELASAGVAMHADPEAFAIIGNAAPQVKDMLFPAVEEDWGREYLGLEISVAVVDGVSQAIAHIARYGTGHSECIVADPDEPSGVQAIGEFTSSVDAAAVYVNASTRFTDGGCFGMGAEIGISTQKLHVRGPFATQALTTWKYVIEGTGQVRG